MNVEQELTDHAVGAHIRTVRRARNLEQRHLAVRMVSLGFDTWTQQVVAKVELGQRSLRLIEAIALAAVLDCEVEELAGRVAGVVTPHAREILEGVVEFLAKLAAEGNLGAARMLSPAAVEPLAPQEANRQLAAQ